MSTVEHYFENLLFHDHDINGDPNKNALSKEVQDAVEQCVNYIKYTYKSKEDEEEWIGGELGTCSKCGHEGSASDIWNNIDEKDYHCPKCGRRVIVRRKYERRKEKAQEAKV